MAKIVKAEGLTDSERFLAILSERSFLSLWSYPNVYRDVGKELCDLLVVCGKHVLIFSDKSIAWPSGVPTELAWKRWYRRAIASSAMQLKRAGNWLQRYPDRLFLDAQCKQPFPIEFPQSDQLELHYIIVARGAAKACVQHFGSGSGSLGLMPLSSRTRQKSDNPPVPFFVGNPSPTESDVYHILDDITLQIMLNELDTIVDFTDYLKKKSRLIAGDHLISAHGEEELLAYYLKDLNEHGDHDFVIDSGRAVREGEALIIEGGSYQAFRRRGEYRRKAHANRISYVWDSLIESFARNIIADTTYVVRGYEDFHSPSKRELGLRQMALVSRLERRTHGLAIKGAFERIGKRDRFFRAMLPGEQYEDRSTGFFVLLVKRDTLLKEMSDEDYRRFRANLSYGYALNILRKVPYLERVVGIATEGEIRRSHRSEDLIYAERPEWTTERIEEVETLSEKMNILQGDALSPDKLFHIRPFEYPPSHHKGTREQSPLYSYRSEPETVRGNRRERRAARAKSRSSN